MPTSSWNLPLPCRNYIIQQKIKEKEKEIREGDANLFGVKMRVWTKNGSQSASQPHTMKSNSGVGWNHGGEKLKHWRKAKEIRSEGEVTTRLEIVNRLRTGEVWKFSKNVMAKMKSVKCLGNKYPYSIFNLSHTRTQEIKLEGVISNCQSYGLD